MRSFENISNQLERHLDEGDVNNNYIKPENTSILKKFVRELELVGTRCSGLESGIEKLNWFAGGDPQKIKELQRKLNELGLQGDYGALEEYGVYNKNTQSAWYNYTQIFVKGSVSVLNWIDPLQNNFVELQIRSSFDGHNNTIQSINLQNRDYNKNQFFRIDNAHYDKKGNAARGMYRNKEILLDKPHINVDFTHVSKKYPNGKYAPTKFQKTLEYSLNHYKLSDEQYNFLKDLDAAGKKVRIGGKIFLVAGIALDAFEIYNSIEFDGKFTKDEATDVASIVGSWGGAALLAKGDAVLGGFTGPAAPIAVPVLAFIGGVAGAFIGDHVGEKVIDITYVE